MTGLNGAIAAMDMLPAIFGRNRFGRTFMVSSIVGIFLFVLAV
jgi:hypothetical protein